jgi:hypothetical protein
MKKTDVLKHIKNTIITAMNEGELPKYAVLIQTMAKDEIRNSIAITIRYNKTLTEKRSSNIRNLPVEIILKTADFSNEQTRIDTFCDDLISVLEGFYEMCNEVWLKGKIEFFKQTINNVITIIMQITVGYIYEII